MSREVPASRRAKARSAALGHRPGHAFHRRRGKGWRRHLEFARNRGWGIGQKRRYRTKTKERK